MEPVSQEGEKKKKEPGPPHWLILFIEHCSEKGEKKGRRGDALKLCLHAVSRKEEPGTRQRLQKIGKTKRGGRRFLRDPSSDQHGGQSVGRGKGGEEEGVVAPPCLQCSAHRGKAGPFETHDLLPNANYGVEKEEKRGGGQEGRMLVNRRQVDGEKRTQTKRKKGRG